MRCPFCGNEDTQVKDSRPTEDNAAIRRRRYCQSCGSRFTTFERQELSNMIVVKRDGTREPYSRTKIERGVWLACTKRPITREQTDRILNKLEEKWSSNKKEVASSTIGMDVMRELKKMDDVAYIRFASVYKSFQDVGDFAEAVEAVRKSPARRAKRTT